MPGDPAGRHDPVDLSTRLVGLTPSQKSLHNNFRISVGSFQKNLVQAIFFLAKINELRIHRFMGFRTIGEYAQAVAGLSAGQTKEFLHLARKLPDYPLITAALGGGKLSWTKARDIIHGSQPAKEGLWIEQAPFLSRKDLHQALKDAKGNGSKGPEVSGMQDPEAPEDPVGRKRVNRNPRKLEAGETPHFVTLKFSAEEYSRWKNLISNQRVNQQSKEEALLAALYLVANGVQGQGSVSPPPYLTVLLHCPDCGDSAIPGPREESSVNRALLEAGFCDAILEDEVGNRRSVIPPRTRRGIFRRARFRCEKPGCTNIHFLQIHHRVPVAQGGKCDPDNLILLCWKCHRMVHQMEKWAAQALRGSR